MKKEEFIEKHGEEKYENHKERISEWRKGHPTWVKESNRKHQPDSLKGGKYYEARKRYNSTGLRSSRLRIRSRHAQHYRGFKQIIAPKSQIHHEWIPNTCKYRGVALVERDPHQYGIINPIVILEGEITLLTEAEIRAK